jgi:hypothetical protein
MSHQVQLKIWSPSRLLQAPQFAKVDASRFLRGFWHPGIAELIKGNSSILHFRHVHLWPETMIPNASVFVSLLQLGWLGDSHKLQCMDDLCLNILFVHMLQFNFKCML